MKWIFQSRAIPTTQTPKYLFGFVYIITFTDGSQYIGKKQIWMEKNLPALKSGIVRKGFERIYKIKKRKRVPIDHGFIEDKWRDYEGSSQYRDGRVVKKKEILHWTFSKKQNTYLEEKEMFSRGVLETDHYLNATIRNVYFNKEFRDGNR